MTHVPFGTLVDFVRGLGSAVAREQVREHLSSCAHCERTASGLTRLTEIAAAEMDCEVPDDVVDEAIALFTGDAADRRALAEVAELFSNRARRRPTGGRPDVRALGQPRFLRFTAPRGEIEVQLLVIEEAEGVSVSGQIIPRQPGSPSDWDVSVHRTALDEAMARTRATSGGRFQLRYDPPAEAVVRFCQCGVRVADCGLVGDGGLQIAD